MIWGVGCKSIFGPAGAALMDTTLIRHGANSIFMFGLTGARANSCREGAGRAGGTQFGRFLVLPRALQIVVTRTLLIDLKK